MNSTKLGGPQQQPPKSILKRVDHDGANDEGKILNFKTGGGSDSNNKSSTGVKGKAISNNKKIEIKSKNKGDFNKR